jgi:putative MATE family efflux protein
LGLPFALVAIAGEGYLRGVSRLRLPLVILLAGNVLNALLEVLFVYGLELGIAGSAWATVIAQSVMAAGFVAVSVPGNALRWRPDWVALRSLAGTGGEIFIRTGSLFLVFILAGAILARVGVASLAAHQIAFQLWSFLALALDALAIAAQIIVSHELGAGRAARARELALRTLIWSVVVGAAFAATLIALAGPLGHLFTTNRAVLARLHEIWPIFALMQPINAVVFALDGILIGAGDTRYLMWAMLPCSLLAFTPVAIASLSLGWGIVGVWIAILVFILARLVACGLRFTGDRWAIAGVDVEQGRVDRRRSRALQHQGRDTGPV